LGELRAKSQVTLPGNFRVEIADYISHARCDVRFTSDGAAADVQQNPASDPAALIEISAGGITRQVWLRRNDPAYGRTMIEMPGGALSLSHEHARKALGFSLELINSYRDRNMESSGNPRASSNVRMVDAGRGSVQERAMSLNQPLTYGNYTIRLSHLDERAGGPAAATFRVEYAPARSWEFYGGLTICLGIALALFTRSFTF
jgi:hypothetical protein